MLIIIHYVIGKVLRYLRICTSLAVRSTRYHEAMDNFAYAWLHVRYMVVDSYNLAINCFGGYDTTWLLMLIKYVQ